VTGQGDAMEDLVTYHVRALQCHAPGTLARIFAENQLHGEFYPVVIANVKRRIRHSRRLAIDADDIANLTLYRTMKRSSESSKHEVWNRVAFLKFCIVVSNRLVSVEKRHCSRQKRSANVFPLGTSPLISVELIQSTDVESDPTYRIDEAEMIELISVSLDDNRLREVFLYKLQGYTAQEMATQLDCDRRTIERNLCCMRKRIQETLTRNKPR